MSNNIGNAFINIQPEIRNQRANFLEGIIIDDIASETQRIWLGHMPCKSLVVIVQGEDLNGKIGVCGAEDFSWNPYGASHYTAITNDDKTFTEVILRLEWFDCLDITEGIETAVKFACKELGVLNFHQVAEGIAGTIFKAWQDNTDIHSDICLRFDFN